MPLLYSIDDKAFEILVQASIESFHTNAGVVSDSDFERMQGALGEGQVRGSSRGSLALGYWRAAFVTFATSHRTAGSEV